MTERFSASVAGRHMTCHASANLELAIPGWVPPVDDRTADNAANRGTSMHEVFAKVMELSTHDVLAMSDAITYVAALRESRRFKVLVEQPVQATWLVTQPWTTADLVLYTADEIHVLDLKTGRIPVEVCDNHQLLFYAVCYAPLAPKATGVNLHIVQPWARGSSHWFADTLVLKQFMADAQATEHSIGSGDVTFGPSDHCLFCPAYPHSRRDKGKPMCPVTLNILYPGICDEDEILAL